MEFSSDYDWWIDNNLLIPEGKKPRVGNEVWTLTKLFDQHSSTVEISDNPKRHKKLLKQYESNSRHFRILKHDIRKSYSSMVANIINSGDFQLIRRFFQTFGLPTVEMDIHHDPFGSYDTKYQTNGNFQGKFQGADFIACVLGAFTNSSPDYAVQIQDAQIRIRSDTEGSIVMYNYIVRATYLYDFSIEKLVKDALQALSTTARTEATAPACSTTITATTNSTSSKKRRMESNDSNKTFPSMSRSPSTVNFDDFIAKMTQLQFSQDYVIAKKRPYLLTVHGNCTMSLDEQQRIKYISFTRSFGHTTYFQQDSAIATNVIETEILLSP